VITHERIHSGQKPFTCAVCRKAFGQKLVLMGYLQVHSGERPLTSNMKI
jgi:hypothetical protein